MGEQADASTSGIAVESRGPCIPLRVVYDPITGVPSEFNEFLPPDSAEFKKWKAAQSAPAEGLEQLTIGGEDPAAELDKKQQGNKKKKAVKLHVLLETRQVKGKKCVTTVSGLDGFGVKLGDAAKAFGKKFACGASVVKNATGTEQIDMQGDCLEPLAELVIKNYGTKNNISKDDVYFINGDKKKVKFFDEDDEDGEGDEDGRD